jgi:CheY-like chemotaxis protein
MMKILVVEDDPLIREIAVTGLEDAGYEAIAAGCGGEALRLLQAGIAVDALLTDVRMPEVSGWVVARAYRERFPDLPVLYVTGYAEQMQPVPGGIIIWKPYRMAQVVDVLAAWAAADLARETLIREAQAARVLAHARMMLSRLKSRIPKPL